MMINLIVDKLILFVLYGDLKKKENRFSPPCCAAIVEHTPLTHGALDLQATWQRKRTVF